MDDHIRVGLRVRKWRVTWQWQGLNDEVVPEAGSRPQRHHQIEKQLGALACGSQKYLAGLTTEPREIYQEQSQQESAPARRKARMSEEQHNIEALILAVQD